MGKFSCRSISGLQKGFTVSGPSIRFNLKILPFEANFRLETTPADMHKIGAAPPAETGPGVALEAPMAAPK